MFDPLPVVDQWLTKPRVWPTLCGICKSVVRNDDEDDSDNSDDKITSMSEREVKVKHSNGENIKMRLVMKTMITELCNYI